MNEFIDPDYDACISVLNKLGIDKDKLNLDCQDWQYTLADAEYLNKYIELYGLSQTSRKEKRVLSCFIIESLEYLLPNKVKNDDVVSILSMLSNDMEIHKTEFEEWSLLEDEHYINHPEDCWYITKYIRAFI